MTKQLKHTGAGILSMVIPYVTVLCQIPMIKLETGKVHLLVSIARG